MRIKLIFTVLIVCVLLCFVANHWFCGRVKQKLSNLKQKMQLANMSVDDEVSGGRFIELTIHLDNENNIQYYLVYENALKMYRDKNDLCDTCMGML